MTKSKKQSFPFLDDLDLERKLLRKIGRAIAGEDVRVASKAAAPGPTLAPV